jgi:hypothetical protein
MKQTAVEFLFEMLKDSSKEVFDGNIWEQAKEMEKQKEYETKAYWFGRGVLAGRENRIAELQPQTYGSKGSDVPQLKYKDGTPIRSYDSPKIQEMVKLMNEPTSSQTEISDDRTKLHWKTSLVVHTPEISDEEIWKAAESQATFAPSFVRGVEWFREQLKKNL